MTTIVCDVNETLLDLAGLDDAFRDVFADRWGEVKRLWFARLLHTSTVMATVGTWQDFGVVARAVLRDTAERLALPLTDAQAGDLVGGMRELGAHPDVVDGIAALVDAGHRVVALTNSGQATAEAQLAHAGLATRLDRILSVDATLRFKPDPAVYAHAAEVLEAAPSELVMVAAHDWDCAGAMRCGWRAGFLRRPGQTFNPLLQPPTWQAADLVALAAAIGDAR